MSQQSLNPLRYLMLIQRIAHAVASGPHDNVRDTMPPEYIKGVQFGVFLAMRLLVSTIGQDTETAREELYKELGLTAEKFANMDAALAAKADDMLTFMLPALLRELPSNRVAQELRSEKNINFDAFCKTLGVGMEAAMSAAADADQERGAGSRAFAATGATLLSLMKALVDKHGYTFEEIFEIFELGDSYRDVLNFVLAKQAERQSHAS